MRTDLKSSVKTLLIFSALIGMGLLFAGKSTKLQTRISVLKGMNAVLEEQNVELKKRADGLQKAIDSITAKVGEMERRDSSLAKRNIDLENEIKKNKKRYETNRNRTDGFNADSLRSYFSTIE